MAISSPRFPTRTPEGFIELVRAQGAGPVAAWKRQTGGDVLVFDLSRATDGIVLTPDPVLQFRPGAYSEWIARRTAG